MPSRKLSQWFLKNSRDLPWRKSQNPYGVWLSEIMLQQTTVKVAIPYYEKFLKAFPEVKNLARAKEEKVLALWSGLGYYSRARNLHLAAKQIVKLGKFPEEYTELLKLKGVGPYTAAAIASIAFEKPHAVMDGNVMRVISRLHDLKEDISLKTTQDKIQKLATKMMGKSNPRIFNQAMMELGATICVPQNPACLVCPVHSDCKALKKGAVNERPVKTKKAKQEPWIWTMNVVVRNNHIAMVKDFNGTPWLKNTWVLPGSAVPVEKNPKDGWDLKHSITKHRIFVRIEQSHDFIENVKWVKPSEIGKLGVSSVVLKIIESVKFKNILKGNAS